MSREEPRQSSCVAPVVIVYWYSNMNECDSDSLNSNMIECDTDSLMFDRPTSANLTVQVWSRARMRQVCASLLITRDP